MRIISTPPAPTGLTRTLFRLPIQLYRWRLGWLLGKRFVLVQHRGRNSGLRRRVVLEVIDIDPQTTAVTVASGYGTRSHWYRNLRCEPEATIQLGNRRTRARATFPSTAEGGLIMARYASRYPRTAKRLCRFMGFAVDGSTDDFTQVGEHIRFVRLTPQN